MSEQTLDKILAALQERMSCHDIGEARAILSRALAAATEEMRRERDEARAESEGYAKTLNALHAEVEKAEAECATAVAEHEAWISALGNRQLTHALARLEAERRTASLLARADEQEFHAPKNEAERQGRIKWLREAALKEPSRA